MTLLTNFWQLFMVSAPWLLLGLFIAALLNVYLPKDFLNKHLGKEGFWTTVKAALIGAPMPLCSCGVIPAAIGLRRAGASKSATTAFLVSTPETGIDSISVSYVLLGPFMAIIRPIAAIASAITAGLLVGKESKHEHKSDNHTHQPSEKQSASCCAAKASSPSAVKEVVKEDEKVTVSCCAPKAEVKPKTTSCCASTKADMVIRDESESKQTSCCAPVITSSDEALITEDVASCCDSHEATPTTSSQWTKLKQAFHFSATKLLQDTAVWLLIGLFFAALVQTYVPEGFLAQWGTGLLAMTVMVLVSIPMYICATASTPIAAGLLLSGVSPGAVLVFMLAGPATNIATLGVVGKELGKRAVAAYLTGVIGMALVFGYLTDYLVAEYGLVVAPTMAHGHEVLPYWLELGAAMLLAGLLVRLAIIFIDNKMQARNV
ncbi:SO_0444 family Cu/Zn efflux transporter [Pseudoalteromonas tunicata]|uniref:Permease n=1 Tax=Pseudoalteromonas tunicata D2 TaxID=87626 RepID=A4C9B5_9GAMM|nr:SO_0444 family Cu/Zn efflux transporter [Pseudoalteromonas tunicata]ATC93684.1 hypothetical protein PTUN_a0981 [Pseudoalteromonas tunicata]AXT29513.1 permease [Pseudoalteromonas tunicata]EAR29180.1 hypothetical protein PTD2_09049 [Pseudoalteromonas tunicata D2]